MPTFSASPSSPPSLSAQRSTESLAAFACDLRDGVVGGFLVDVQAGDRGALAREQHAHRAAVADRRLSVHGGALSRADHDDAPAVEAAVVLCQSQRFRMQ
ncbi:hypothetical protein [Bradyrhizobium sp. 2S1]|uniref:hypothetical protein n=1 Tax=Bradyrhizobium sp. 2S1 TaxID=1404429 RepID=UPI002896BE3E|nr:hypothetical protein [Bradyrhizobium sp. 2S1]